MVDGKGEFSTSFIVIVFNQFQLIQYTNWLTQTKNYYRLLWLDDWFKVYSRLLFSRWMFMWKRAGNVLKTMVSFCSMKVQMSHSFQHWKLFLRSFLEWSKNSVNECWKFDEWWKTSTHTQCIILRFDVFLKPQQFHSMNPISNSNCLSHSFSWFIVWSLLSMNGTKSLTSFRMHIWKCIWHCRIVAQLFSPHSNANRNGICKQTKYEEWTHNQRLKH